MSLVGIREVFDPIGLIPLVAPAKPTKMNTGQILDGVQTKDVDRKSNKKS